LFSGGYSFSITLLCTTTGGIIGCWLFILKIGGLKAYVFLSLGILNSIFKAFVFQTLCLLILVTDLSFLIVLIIVIRQNANIVKQISF